MVWFSDTWFDCFTVVCWHWRVIPKELATEISLSDSLSILIAFMTFINYTTQIYNHTITLFMICSGHSRVHSAHIPWKWGLAVCYCQPSTGGRECNCTSTWSHCGSNSKSRLSRTKRCFRCVRVVINMSLGLWRIHYSVLQLLTMIQIPHQYSSLLDKDQEPSNLSPSTSMMTIWLNLQSPSQLKEMFLRQYLQPDSQMANPPIQSLSTLLITMVGHC